MTFTARYTGRCAECGDTIRAGDQLEWVDGEAAHADCVAPIEHPRRPTCPECWQEIAASGACGCDG